MNLPYEVYCKISYYIKGWRNIIRFANTCHTFRNIILKNPRQRRLYLDEVVLFTIIRLDINSLHFYGQRQPRKFSRKSMIQAARKYNVGFLKYIYENYAVPESHFNPKREFIVNTRGNRRRIKPADRYGVIAFHPKTKN